MHKILIVDFSSYKEVLSKLLEENNYDVKICESAFDAMSQLKSQDYDLVISEVELPGDNAFDLYYYINKHYPYIPTIMITKKDIDTFFDKIFEQGIGNVLSKPLKKNELLNLIDKLISKRNIFGLNNYIKNITEQKKITITASAQIKDAIKITTTEIEAWGFAIKNKILLNLVLNEVAINAVYHSHGLTREKEARMPVTLKKGESVDIFFGRSANKFGISIVDHKGILTKNKILESINHVVEQSNLIEKAYETGEDVSPLISETGRGFDLVRKLSGEYYFIIKKAARTEIIFIFESGKDASDNISSSLKIIEDL